MSLVHNHAVKSIRRDPIQAPIDGRQHRNSEVTNLMNTLLNPTLLAIRINAGHCVGRLLNQLLPMRQKQHTVEVGSDMRSQYSFTDASRQGHKLARNTLF